MPPNPVRRYLAWGGFPEHVTNPFLSEVRQRIRNDAIDRAIFDSAARARLLQRPGLHAADPRSVEKWLELLEDTLLIARLEPFAKAATSKLAGRARPKLYATDHALVVAFSTAADPLAEPAVLGHVVETAVFRHLRQLRPRRVTYHREGKGGTAEIDFIVEANGRRAAVEVTHGLDASDKLAAMVRVRAKLKVDAAVVIHGGALSAPNAIAD